MPNKKYRVELTKDERSHLLERLGRGERPAAEQMRVRVLLKVDEGPEGPVWTDARTAEALEVASGTVAGIRERFCKRGLSGCVERKSPDREYDRKLDGEQEAKLIQLACSKAPEGRSRRSLRLLADRMVELDVVEGLSHETVRQTLKKLSQAPPEPPMGDSAGAKRELCGEDGRCAFRLQAPIRPESPSGLHGRDAAPADQRGAHTVSNGSRQTETSRRLLQAQWGGEPVYVLRAAGRVAHGDDPRAAHQNRLDPLHEAAP